MVVKNGLYVCQHKQPNLTSPSFFAAAHYRSTIAGVLDYAALLQTAYNYHERSLRKFDYTSVNPSIKWKPHRFVHAIVVCHYVIHSLQGEISKSMGTFQSLGAHMLGLLATITTY